MLITCQLRDVPPVDPEGMAFRQLPTEVTLSRRGSRIFCRGGGVNDDRVQRAPLAPAPMGGLGLINIRLRYIASIEYSERFFFFLAIVKKFVEKENWWSRAGGSRPPPPPPGSAPAKWASQKMHMA